MKIILTNYPESSKPSAANLFEAYRMFAPLRYEEKCFCVKNRPRCLEGRRYSHSVPKIFEKTRNLFSKMLKATNLNETREKFDNVSRKSHWLRSCLDGLTLIVAKPIKVTKFTCFSILFVSYWSKIFRWSTIWDLIDCEPVLVFIRKSEKKSV